MNRRSICLSLCCLLLVSACASRHVPTEVVDSWSQLPDERGKLPVGVVIAVERTTFKVDRPASPTPYVRGAESSGKAMTAVLDAIRDSGLVYLHSVRMAGGGLRQFTLDHEYKVGECVALRSGLDATDQWPVRALPDECRPSK